MPRATLSHAQTPHPTARRARRRPFAALLLGLALGTAAAAAALPPLQFSGEPTLAFTQADRRAGLAQTKRVLISNLVLEVQTRVKAEYITGRLSKMLLHRNNTESLNSLKGYRVEALQAAADRLYAQLQQQLTAAGYELVSPAELEALPAYQKLIAGMGHAQGQGFDNAEGNSFLVGPSALKLYLPTPAEQPTFSLSKKGVGKADEPGRGWGDNARVASEGSYSAGREVEIAKALNAHLLKAWYVVGFGQATAETGWDGSQTTITGGGFSSTTTTGATQKTGATAQLYLRADATRLALRFPNGDTGYARNASAGLLSGQQFANDGDLVIRLDDSVIGSADFLAEGGVQKKVEEQSTAGKVLGFGAALLQGLAGKSGGLSDKSQEYLTQVDPEAFAQRAAEVAGWVQGKLVERLKP